MSTAVNEHFSPGILGDSFLFDLDAPAMAVALSYFSATTRCSSAVAIAPELLFISPGASGARSFLPWTVIDGEPLFLSPWPAVRAPFFLSPMAGNTSSSPSIPHGRGRAPPGRGRAPCSPSSSSSSSSCLYLC
ncbi:unnamed protein product [Urochloa humidicola]